MLKLGTAVNKGLIIEFMTELYQCTHLVGLFGIQRYEYYNNNFPRIIY